MRRSGVRSSSAPWFYAMKIILGSQSPGRKKILQSLGYNFRVMHANFDEKSIRLKNPKKLVKILAQAKATKLLTRIKQEAILITADQVVLCHSKILEKPKNQNEIKKFLKLYSKFPATTVTAIAVTNTATNKQKIDVNLATIWFKPMEEKTMEKIANRRSNLHYAGGFTIDDPMYRKYIKKINGDEDSIIGLPSRLLLKMLPEIMS